MPLSKKAATKIVESVVNDPESKKRIESLLSFILPDGLGIAGAVRNVGIMLAVNVKNSLHFELPDGLRPADEDENPHWLESWEDLVCVGIAEASSDAINRTLASGRGIREVKSASQINRSLSGTYHVATLVTMKDESEFVFDWHETLNIENPLVYPRKDWENGVDGVEFDEFPTKSLR